MEKSEVVEHYKAGYEKNSRRNYLFLQLMKQIHFLEMNLEN